MDIRQITPDMFTKFADDHEFKNFHQTFNYALLKVEEGYEYEFIGYYENGILKAASLVLGKKINNKPYGYIPAGFLIDYEDKELLKRFTEALFRYYHKQGFIFIKINPRVIIGNVNKKDGSITPNEYRFLPSYLESIGYKKLKDNLLFEARLPRFSALIDLENFSINTINKNTRNKVKKAQRKGVVVKQGVYEDVEYLTNLLSKKMDDVKFHYSDYYSIFDKNNMIDYYTAEIDYQEYLKNAQTAYDKEIVRNKILNSKVIANASERNVNAKINSDTALDAYHSDIIKATKLVNEKSGFVAAALVVKYQDTVTLLVNDYDKSFKDFAPNYLLIYSIINKYRDQYRYFDLNGIVGDFNDNPYHGLNRFKIGFNPYLVEYAGEYDLVINKPEYDRMNSKGLLAEEFNKD
jgi:peptidoglycan pentaglycine glycine transferase (the first glycine)